MSRVQQTRLKDHLWAKEEAEREEARALRNRGMGEERGVPFQFPLAHRTSLVVACLSEPQPFQREKAKASSRMEDERVERLNQIPIPSW